MDRRAELKEQYKNRLKNIGIFQIKNQINGKVFIGSTPNLEAMANRFRMGLKYGNFSNGNPGLTNEMKEYGSENFSFEVLDKLKPSEDPLYDYKEDLKTLEELWLEKLQPYEERGYHKRSKLEG